jgi:hypothetical protein
MPEDELQRIADRAGLETSLTNLHPVAFRDRHGNLHLPLEAAVAIARAFAAAEPQTVVMYIDDRESELKISGFHPGYRYRHDLLREYAPGFALARRWAGTEQEAEMLRKEIGRLRSLVSQAASELRGLGKDRQASRLLRALDGR